MRVLTVGCGSIGRRHLRNLRLLGIDDLHAYDPSVERMEQAFAESGARPCHSFEEGLARRPALVVVATPSSKHLEPALAAARQGCHLFIEKPLAATADGVDDLIVEAERRDLITLVGCNMRFHPAVSSILELVRGGRIGRVVTVRVLAGSYLPDWHPWEDYRNGYSARAELGGGAILDGIHEIDYVLEMLGPAREVFCAAGHFSDLEVDVEDVAVVIVRSAGGALAEIHLDYVQRAYRRDCLVGGTDGTVWWESGTSEVRLYGAAAGTWVTRAVDESDINRMYVLELEHLLRCLAGKERPVQDLRKARLALEVVSAAKRSASTGRAVSIGPE